VSSPPASESRPSCELVLCEDPDTHEILIKPKGECPAGYVERIRDKAAADGVTFLIPKVKTRAVDE
jgi:hypothetical protein